MFLCGGGGGGGGGVVEKEWVRVRGCPPRTIFKLKTSAMAENSSKWVKLFLPLPIRSPYSVRKKMATCTFNYNYLRVVNIAFYWVIGR